MNQHRYLDDFAVGETFISGGITFTESDIIDFAMNFDPQPFHLDTEAAAHSLYGGLIASGLHTVSVCFRLFIQGGLLAKCSMGSPGIDEMRWLVPVRPGDTLHSKVEVIEVKPSSKRPDRGILRLKYAAINQHGETVSSFIVNHLVKRSISTTS
ncbi:MAG: MaoC family dehydratase [Candidatus Thiodiazotropha sp. (ex Epidulcina cf. delphinae)]|nr:MaoC family dehydratase [Candidatus Thiodiazotropha sp. (ex Epidulcina cf. delphinae)]